MEFGSTATMKALLILLLFCSWLSADITGRVVAATDGDTIKVLDADNTEYKKFA